MTLGPEEVSAWSRSPTDTKLQQESHWASVKGAQVPLSDNVMLCPVWSHVCWSMLNYLQRHSKLPQTFCGLNNQHSLSCVVFVSQNPRGLAGCFWCGPLVRCPSVSLPLSWVPSGEERFGMRGLLFQRLGGKKQPGPDVPGGKQSFTMKSRVL